ncbi:hypothetical protein ACJX0J_016701 [Zea mays]
MKANVCEREEAIDTQHSPSDYLIIVEESKSLLGVSEAFLGWHWSFLFMSYLGFIVGGYEGRQEDGASTILYEDNMYHLRICTTPTRFTTCQANDSSLSEHQQISFRRILDIIHLLDIFSSLELDKKNRHTYSRYNVVSRDRFDLFELCSSFYLHLLLDLYASNHKSLAQGASNLLQYLRLRWWFYKQSSSWLLLGHPANL